MNKTRASLAGMALAGAFAISLSAPAAASPASADSLTAQAEPTKAQKLRRLAVTTLVGIKSLEAWSYDYNEYLNSRNWLRLNWTTDYCSSSPDKPGGFNFKQPCQRHDFGYRNYKGLNEFTSTRKERIDNAFLYDMERICRIQPGFTSYQRTACRKTAKTYYNAVRATGIL